MPSYKETADDLNRKYLGCFIYYDSKLVYCRQFEQDGSNIVGQLQIAGMKEKYQLVEIDPSKFVTIDLASQWFNLSDEARKKQSLELTGWKYVRKAHRQNKKGISNETAYVASFMGPVFKLVAKPYRDPVFTAELINDVVQGKYPSYKEGLNACPASGTIALSPAFAIGLSHISKDKFLIMSQFGFVGECDANVIEVHHKGSLQEIQDYVRRNRESIEVRFAG